MLQGAIRIRAPGAIQPLLAGQRYHEVVPQEQLHQMAQGSAPETCRGGFEGGQKGEGKEGEEDYQKAAAQIYICKLLHRHVCAAFH